VHLLELQGDESCDFLHRSVGRAATSVPPSPRSRLRRLAPGQHRPCSSGAYLSKRRGGLSYREMSRELMRQKGLKVSRSSAHRARLGIQMSPCTKFERPSRMLSIR
jgi:hypothetical protein